MSSKHRTELHGHGFDYIPNDAIARIATENNDPTQHVNDGTDWSILNMVEKTDSVVVFEQNVEGSFGLATYLGAICSLDGSSVYWVNNTKPLP